MSCDTLSLVTFTWVNGKEVVVVPHAGPCAIQGLFCPAKEPGALKYRSESRLDIDDVPLDKGAHRMRSIIVEGLYRMRLPLFLHKANVLM